MPKKYFLLALPLFIAIFMIWGAGAMFLTLQRVRVLQSAEVAQCYKHSLNPATDCLSP
jgi:hypothetical protein